MLLRNDTRLSKDYTALYSRRQYSSEYDSIYLNSLGKFKSYVRFDVLTVVTMGSTILWDVTTRSLIEVTDVSEGNPLQSHYKSRGLDDLFRAPL
jgi:hypothetical protein